MRRALGAHNKRRADMEKFAEPLIEFIVVFGLSLIATSVLTALFIGALHLAP
jgi:hypothetical protein